MDGRRHCSWGAAEAMFAGGSAWISGQSSMRVHARFCITTRTARTTASKVHALTFDPR